MHAYLLPLCDSFRLLAIVQSTVAHSTLRVLQQAATTSATLLGGTAAVRESVRRPPIMMPLPLHKRPPVAEQLYTARGGCVFRSLGTLSTTCRRFFTFFSDHHHDVPCCVDINTLARGRIDLRVRKTPPDVEAQLRSAREFTRREMTAMMGPAAAASQTVR